MERKKDLGMRSIMAHMVFEVAVKAVSNTIPSEDDEVLLKVNMADLKNEVEELLFPLVKRYYTEAKSGSAAKAA